MSCQICFNSYDHSRHRPYHLSCPHTFCLDCLDKLRDNKCPSCKTPIQFKNPNLALLEFIPESTYDSLKQQLHRSLTETNDLKNTLTRDWELSISNHLNKFKSLKKDISSKSTELIKLIKNNEVKLLHRANEHENNITKQFDKLKIDNEIETKLSAAKLNLNTNEMNEKELSILNDEISTLKTKLNALKTNRKVNHKLELICFQHLNIATGVYAELISNENEFEDLMKKGKEFQSIKNYTESIKYFNEAIEINSTNASVYNFKAVSLSALEEYKQAIDCYSQSIQLDQNDAVVYCNKGIVLANIKEFKDSIEFLDKAIQLNPNYVIAYKEKGRVLMSLLNYNESIQCFDKAIALNPNDASLYNLKGLALSELKETKQAIELYSKALQLDPPNSVYHYNKSVALRHFNQYNEMIKCLNKAVEMNHNLVFDFGLKRNLSV